MEELAVRCPNLDAGCEFTGERQFLESHLKLECPYVQVPCPCSEVGCERSLARRDVVEGETIIHVDIGPEVRPGRYSFVTG